MAFSFKQLESGQDIFKATKSQYSFEHNTLTIPLTNGTVFVMDPRDDEEHLHTVRPAANYPSTEGLRIALVFRLLCAGHAPGARRGPLDGIRFRGRGSELPRFEATRVPRHPGAAVARFRDPPGAQGGGQAVQARWPHGGSGATLVEDPDRTGYPRGIRRRGSEGPREPEPDPGPPRLRGACLGRRSDRCRGFSPP